MTNDTTIRTAREALEAAEETCERILRDELVGGPRYFAILAIVDEIRALASRIPAEPVVMDFESVLRFVLDYFNVRSDGPSADNIRDLWRVARAAAQPPAPGPMLEQSVGYLQPAPEPLLGAGADLFDGSEDMDALRRHTTTAQRARQLWERRFTDGAWVIDVRDFLREIAEEKP